MSRLVVVSNRLPSLHSSGAVGEPEVPVGGLASALMGALRRNPGSLWLGWSGRIVRPERRNRMSRATGGPVELVGIPLTQEELDRYYLGFCNETLWPAFHCFQGRMRVRLRSWNCYRDVQTRFAAALRPLLRSDDIVWVHDYHLLMLGRELRRMGFGGRIGFFLHIPFPPYEMWSLLPEPREVLEAMLEFDVAGFHVQTFLDNYLYCCRRLLGAQPSGARLAWGERSQHVGVYPVGIEPEDFAPAPGAERADARAGDPQSQQRGGRTRQRRGVLDTVLRDRKLVLGVDRLDYTKGIAERVAAYEEFLRRHTAWHKRVVFVQIASPSRTELPEYAKQKARIESLMGRINGEMGEHDWQPMRYLYRTYAREFLAKLYREADVGLVTPLRDGMNLVAKEYVAAQDPQHPGVLILSRTAGAAEELREALLVNPFVPAEVAKAIDRALAMPREERQQRHAALLEQVQAHTASRWADDFLADLRAVPAPLRVVERGDSPHEQPTVGSG